MDYKLILKGIADKPYGLVRARMERGSFYKIPSNIRI